MLWRFYIHYELASGDARAALRVYFRAVRAVPWAKHLWLDVFQRALVERVQADELQEIKQLMVEKELHVRVLPPD